jgi:hypothetical protein
MPSDADRIREAAHDQYHYAKEAGINHVQGLADRIAAAVLRELAGMDAFPEGDEMADEIEATDV